MSRGATTLHARRCDQALVVSRDADAGRDLACRYCGAPSEEIDICLGCWDEGPKGKRSGQPARDVEIMRRYRAGQPVAQIAADIRMSKRGVWHVLAKRSLAGV